MIEDVEAGNIASIMLLVGTMGKSSNKYDNSEGPYIKNCNLLTPQLTS
jgi:hypothetical protein